MGQSGHRTKEAAEFGRRVRKERHRLGWTQERLADECDMHFTYIGAVERGERNPSLTAIVRIAAGLKMDPGDLVRRLKHGQL